MFNIEKENVDFVAGEVIPIDKPLGWTSFDVIRKLRNHLTKFLGVKKLKVGHAGTLDPLASGLLVVCAGKATKRISEFQDTYKEYVATVKFGATTPSFDLETEIDKEYPFEHITLENLKQVTESFVGEIDQVPPIFSAKNINGKRAYTKARKGEAIELDPVKITIKSIEIVDFQLPLLVFKILCSKGTYIRSLANDVGKAAGSGAHLVSLRRTKIGDINIEDAISIETFTNYLEKGKQNDNSNV
jgi:tRNA pseudouridine55 synthase